MEVARGGRQGGMSHQALNGMQVDAGFERVGGEGVAQGMDAGGPTRQFQKMRRPLRPVRST